MKELTNTKIGPTVSVMNVNQQQDAFVAIWLLASCMRGFQTMELWQKHSVHVIK